jgi:hypothetical protein
MNHAKVRIDHILVEIEQEAQAQDALEAIRSALAILAGRLAGAPLGTARDAPARGLDLIALDPIPARWLSSPQAAAWIADELYQQVLRQWWNGVG